MTLPRKNQEADSDALFLLRHSCAHVMAEAIQRVIPGALLVYGPPLDTGFYYDISVPEDRPISSKDFEAIASQMMADVARCHGQEKALEQRGLEVRVAQISAPPRRQH